MSPPAPETNHENHLKAYRRRCATPCSAGSPPAMEGCLVPPRRSGGTGLRSMPETTEAIRGGLWGDTMPNLQGPSLQPSIPEASLPVV